MDTQGVILSFMQQFVYGEVIPKSWFHERLDYDHESAEWEDTQAYGRRFTSVKDALLEDCKVYLHDIAEGYLFAHPKDQAQLAHRRAITEITNSLRHAARAAHFVKSEELTDEQRKELSDTANRVAGLQQIFTDKKSIRPE